MMKQVKLLATTAVLTVIIWVCADQASQESATVWVTVRLVAGGAADVVPVIETPGPRAPTDAGTARVRVDLSGPKVAIRQISHDESSSASEYQIQIPDTWTGGHYNLDVVDALNRTRQVRERGLHVTNAYPPSLRILVDRWTTARFAVRADPGPLAASVSGPLDVQPASVAGRIRESFLAKLGPGEPAVVVPVHELLREAQGRTGAVSFTVPLPRMVQDMPVEFQPGEVAVTATLTQRTASKRLSRIPVSVMLNPDMIGQYKVVWGDPGDRIQSVDVRVPPDKAETLTAENVRAFVQIGREDVVPGETGAAATQASTEGWITRTVQFMFPPGYEDVRVEGPGPSVRLKIVELPATAGLPGVAEAAPS